MPLKFFPSGTPGGNRKIEAEKWGETMATTEQIDLEQELKERLIRRIETTHNLGVLRGVLSLLDEIASDGVYVLTPEEEKMLDEAEAELDAGLGISGEEFREKNQTWLNELAKNYT